MASRNRSARHKVAMDDQMNLDQLMELKVLSSV